MSRAESTAMIAPTTDGARTAAGRSRWAGRPAAPPVPGPSTASPSARPGRCTHPLRLRSPGPGRARCRSASSGRWPPRGDGTAHRAPPAAAPLGRSRRPAPAPGAGAATDSASAPSTPATVRRNAGLPAGAAFRMRRRRMGTPGSRVRVVRPANAPVHVRAAGARGSPLVMHSAVALRLPRVLVTCNARFGGGAHTRCPKRLVHDRDASGLSPRRTSHRRHSEDGGAGGEQQSPRATGPTRRGCTRRRP
jgi:hypothetical protein